MRNKNKFYASVLTWAAVLGMLYLTRQYNELLFHALAEMFSVAVAVAIFMLVWNVRRSLDNPFLLFVGVAYLFIGCLDLVISVDTAVAHLAGAMGKPVWVLLPFAADWRWLLDRRSSPWYPTMRLFRQHHPRQWENVVKQVVAELSQWMATPNS